MVLLAFSAPLLPSHEQIRERLWAVSYGEREPDTASVSAPVFGVTGELQGAVAVSGPRQRLTPPEAMLVACQEVLASAREATVKLGGDGARLDRSLSQLARDDFRFAGTTALRHSAGEPD